MTTRRVIIGLAGRKRVGKDSIADILKGEFGFGSDSFAAPFRNFVYQLIGAAQDQEIDKEKTIDWLGASPRHLMQTLGNEWGRKMIHPEIWINALRNRLTLRNRLALSRSYWPLVITDVRYENEAQTVRDMGGWIVHVRRPQLPYTDMHESESDLVIQKSDGIVYNDDDLAALQSTVRNALIPAITELFGEME